MSNPKEFDEGQVVRLQAKFYNSTDVLADPSAIRFYAKHSSGSNAVDTTSGWTRESTGIYYYDLALVKEGRWYYRWEGSGVVAAAREGVVVVRRSRFV